MDSQGVIRPKQQLYKRTAIVPSSVCEWHLQADDTNTGSVHILMWVGFKVQVTLLTALKAKLVLTNPAEMDLWALKQLVTGFVK